MKILELIEKYANEEDIKLFFNSSTVGDMYLLQKLDRIEHYNTIIDKLSQPELFYAIVSDILEGLKKEEKKDMTIEEIKQELDRLKQEISRLKQEVEKPKNTENNNDLKVLSIDTFMRIIQRHSFDELKKYSKEAILKVLFDISIRDASQRTADWKVLIVKSVAKTFSKEEILSNIKEQSPYAVFNLELTDNLIKEAIRRLNDVS